MRSHLLLASTLVMAQDQPAAETLLTQQDYTGFAIMEQAPEPWSMNGGVATNQEVLTAWPTEPWNSGIPVPNPVAGVEGQPWNPELPAASFLPQAEPAFFPQAEPAFFPQAEPWYNPGVPAEPWYNSEVPAEPWPYLEVPAEPWPYPEVQAEPWPYPEGTIEAFPAQGSYSWQDTKLASWPGNSAAIPPPIDSTYAPWPEYASAPGGPQPQGTFPVPGGAAAGDPWQDPYASTAQATVFSSQDPYASTAQATVFSSQGQISSQSMWYPGMYPAQVPYQSVPMQPGPYQGPYLSGPTIGQPYPGMQYASQGPYLPGPMPYPSTQSPYLSGPMLYPGMQMQYATQGPYQDYVVEKPTPAVFDPNFVGLPPGTYADITTFAELAWPEDPIIQYAPTGVGQRCGGYWDQPCPPGTRCNYGDAPDVTIATGICIIDNGSGLTCSECIAQFDAVQGCAAAIEGDMQRIIELTAIGCVQCIPEQIDYCNNLHHGRNCSDCVLEFDDIQGCQALIQGNYPKAYDMVPTGCMHCKDEVEEYCYAKYPATSQPTGSGRPPSTPPSKAPTPNVYVTPAPTTGETPAPVVVDVTGFERYPGYNGRFEVAGIVEVTAGDTEVTLHYQVSGVDTRCSRGYHATAPNGCGIHVHEGSSCAQAGGHYYENTLVDPWATVRYYSDTGGVAIGFDKVGVGGNVIGRTIVFHDVTGARIACAQIAADGGWPTSPPSQAPSQATEKTCQLGLASVDGEVCCPETCGYCGGKGCASRRGGMENCCRTIILASEKSCERNPPPCVNAPPSSWGAPGVIEPQDVFAAFRESATGSDSIHVWVRGIH